MADSRAEQIGDATDEANRIRAGIRRLARQNNAFGRMCSFLMISVREGPAAAYRKVRLPENAKKREKRFLAALVRPQKSNPEELERYGHSVRISILVPLYNTPLPFLREMIASVQAQTYPGWELCLADGSDDAHASVGEECRKLAASDPRIVYRKLEENRGISENSNACMDLATGEYYALFDHDDLLLPNALMEVVKVIAGQGADFVYSDEFVFASPDKRKIIATHFKPDYSPETLLSNNYICHLSVFRASLLEKAGRFRKEYDGSQDHDLILRLTGCAEKVVHIPQVLYFWRSHPASVASDISTKTYAIDAGRNAVRDFLLTRKQISAAVESAPEYPTLYHVHYPIDGNPSVCILLDCADLPAELIAGRVRKLCGQTEYPSFSVAVLLPENAPDPGLPASVLQIRSAAASRTLRYNDAIRQTAEDYIVLMDPALDCLNRDWLSEMLMLAQHREIGAVGAKLFFSDNTIRHGGLILRLGSRRLVGRSHFGVASETTGYFGQLSVVLNVSAVSAECMMFRRSLFEELQGFTTEYRDTLFDADFCLRLSEKGCRNLFTPFAKLQGGDPKHYSLNYGTEFREYEHDANCFSKRWSERLGKPDPYYNPNLTLDYSDYSIRGRNG